MSKSGGLKCEIITVQNITFKNVKIELRLTNNVFNNLYYLDPNKMGINLFPDFDTGSPKIKKFS